MKLYRLVALVTGAQLTSLVDMGISDFTVETVNNDAPRPPVMKGLSNSELAMTGFISKLSGTTFTIKQARNAMKKAGYTPASASPVLTQLKRRGTVKAIGRGLYEAV